MTETEKTIEYLERLTDEYPAGHITHAIAALHACEEIRALCAEEREAGYCHADLDTLEELLP